MHVHVGYNVPGYLPESAPMCFDDLGRAVEAYRHHLTDLQGDYWERCEASPEDLDRGTCECAWCDVAGDVEAVIASIADGDVGHALGKNGPVDAEWSATFRPPEGADVCHWIMTVAGGLEQCELVDAGFC